MTPDELLERYPRETLRWLRRRLGLSQLGLALELELGSSTVSAWEARYQGISPRHGAPLAALLAPHLVTAEGAAFVQALGPDEAVSDE